MGTGLRRCCKIFEQLDCGQRVDMGDASLDAALATGARRVNLGTAALEDPEWTASVIARHGDAVAVGLDVRGTTLAAVIITV